MLISGLVAVALLMLLTIDDVRTRHTQTYLPFIGALDGDRPADAPVPPHPPHE